MNKTLSFIIVCLFLSLNILGKGDSSLIDDQLDWKSFLSRHDLVWEKTPDDYFNAPFLGNGVCVLDSAIQICIDDA